MSEQPPILPPDDGQSLPDRAQPAPPAYPGPPTYPIAAPAVPALQAPGPAPGLAYAGFGWRALGYVLDRIILFVIEAPITIPFVYIPVAQYYRDHPPAAGQTIATLPTSLSSRFLLIGLLGAVVAAVYFGGLVAWQGRTLGQRAMGTFVVRAEDGGRLPLGRAYLRAIIFWGPDLLGVIPTAGSLGGLIALIGLVSAAWDQRRQGWHDKLGRSLVVRQVPL
ncbi:MAG TPA: RDD family protein [Candidatus Deferrimicrobium sp.]|nr:RDD family protein [Candidatus Deferrimicrobium sp.]